MADDWRTPDTEALIDAILRLDDRDEARAVPARPVHARRAPRHGASAGPSSGCSTRASTTPRSRSGPAPAPRRSRGSPRGSTTARAATGEMLDRLKATSGDGSPPYPTRRRAMRERLRLAIPNKGRLRRADARPARTTPGSCSRSTTGASSRASRTTRSTSCSCARTTSSSSWTTASPSSASPAATSSPRRGVDLPVLRELGYGRCRLAAAVAGDAPYEAIADLAGTPDRHVPPQRHAPVLRATRGSRSR